MGRPFQHTIEVHRHHADGSIEPRTSRSTATSSRRRSTRTRSTPATAIVTSPPMTTPLSSTRLIRSLRMSGSSSSSIIASESPPGRTRSAIARLTVRTCRAGPSRGRLGLTREVIRGPRAGEVDAESRGRSELDQLRQRAAKVIEACVVDEEARVEHGWLRGRRLGVRDRRGQRLPHRRAGKRSECPVHRLRDLAAYATQLGATRLVELSLQQIALPRRRARGGALQRPNLRAEIRKRRVQPSVVAIHPHRILARTVQPRKEPAQLLATTCEHPTNRRLVAKE